MGDVRARTDVELDAYALESALPTLTEKLRSLKGNLNEDEKAVFSSIVRSAAQHLETLQAVNTSAEVKYAKPISAVATTAVRQRLLELPSELGLDEE
jgi:hypothetical protein